MSPKSPAILAPKQGGLVKAWNPVGPSLWRRAWWAAPSPSSCWCGTSAAWDNKVICENFENSCTLPPPAPPPLLLLWPLPPRRLPLDYLQTCNSEGSGSKKPPHTTLRKVLIFLWWYSPGEAKSNIYLVTRYFNHSLPWFWSWTAGRITSKSSSSIASSSTFDSWEKVTQKSRNRTMAITKSSLG